MKKFLTGFGLLRITCALAVLGIHVTARYVDLELPYVLNQFFRFTVPIFFLMSGYFLYRSDLIGNRPIAVGKFYKTRLPKIVIPYLIWLVIYILYNNRHHMANLLNLDYVQILLTGYNHLYFLVIIIQLYLLYPVLRWLFKKNWEIPTLVTSIILTLCFQGVLYLFKLGITGIVPYPMVKYNYLYFPTWLFFFVFGMYFAKKPTKILTLKPSSLLAIWVICFMVLLTDSRLTNTFMYSNKPTVILYSVFSFFLFYQFFNRVHVGNRDKMLRDLSNMTFNFYLSHMLVISLVLSYFKIIGFTTLFNGVGGMFILYLVSAVATFYLCSFLKFLGGLFPSKKRKLTLKSTDASTDSTYAS